MLCLLYVNSKTLSFLRIEINKSIIVGISNSTIRGLQYLLESWYVIAPSVYVEGQNMPNPI